MARTLYGGSPADVIAQVDASDGDYAPATAALTAWDSLTGGTQITDLQNAALSAISQVTPDSIGRVLFYGPDGYAAAIWLQDSSGTRWRINPADLAGRVAPTWTNIPGKPAFVASGPDAATARSAISAAADDTMSSATAIAGTSTAPQQVTATVLKAAIQALSASNVHMQPVWDGTGSHPKRVIPVGVGFEIWRQPTFPQVGPTFSQPGDEFEATQ